MCPGSFKWFYSNDKFYIRYYLTFNFYGVEDFKWVREIDVREYLFSDEEVKEEYEKFHEVMDIEKIVHKEKRTLVYEEPKPDEQNYTPEILHMLKGINQTENKFFDHNFKIRSWCWNKETNINISLTLNKVMFYTDEDIVIKFMLETSEKVSNSISIQCFLIQEVAVKSIESLKVK